MNLIDLMEIWAIKNESDEPMNMLKLESFDNRLDLDLLCGRIVEVCGAMTPIHNTTTSFVYFHKLFFKMWGTQISKLLDTMELQYVPLDNFRRDETLKHSVTENVDTTINNSSTSSTGENTKVDSTEENKVSAYNESVYQPQTESIVGGKQDVNSNTESEYKTTNDKDRTFNANDVNNMHGLNGLATSQSLLKQEREVSEYNVYQWIVQKYMEELFLCVF